MQINTILHTQTATQAPKSGNALPQMKVQDAQEATEPRSMRDLSKSIDPTNMSRNDARAIAGALGQAGKLELDNAIALQSMILVNENGVLRSANEADPIMNEPFDMFDALESQIEFYKSKGLSTSSLEDGLDFLEKFQQLRENPEVDLYV